MSSTLWGLIHLCILVGRTKSRRDLGADHVNLPMIAFGLHLSSTATLDLKTSCLSLLGRFGESSTTGMDKLELHISLQLWKCMVSPCQRQMSFTPQGPSMLRNQPPNHFLQYTNCSDICYVGCIAYAGNSHKTSPGMAYFQSKSAGQPALVMLRSQDMVPVFEKCLRDTIPLRTARRNQPVCPALLGCLQSIDLQGVHSLGQHGRSSEADRHWQTSTGFANVSG